MINRMTPQFSIFIPNRLIRNVFYCLSALGCAIGGHAVIRQSVFFPILDLFKFNGGFFGLIQSGSAQRLEWTPSVVGCFFMMSMVVLFLLQPLFALKRSSNYSLKRSLNRSLKQSSSSLKRSLTRRSTSNLVTSSMTDWVVITDQAIAVGRSQGPMTVPSKLSSFPQNVHQLSVLLSRSQSEVVVLGGSEMTLKSPEVALMVNRLKSEGLEVVSAVSPQLGQPCSSAGTMPSYPALYDFLSASFEVRQTDHRVRVSRSQDSACFIVRREVLLSMLNLWEWSADVGEPLLPVSPVLV